MFRRTKLHPEIRQAIAAGNSGREMKSTYDPDEGFIKVIKAGEILRNNHLYNRKKPLSNRELKDSPNDNTLEQIFRNIVNDSLQTNVEDHGFSYRGCRPYESTCSMAEMDFGRAVTQLAFTNQVESGLRIVHNQEKVPILIQKNEGRRTALSLQTIRIAGVRYPAGSIMGIHISRDFNSRNKRYEPNIPPKTIQTATDDEIAGLDFLRPSLFALSDPEKRSYLDRNEWAHYRHNNPWFSTIAQLSIQNMIKITENFI